MGCCAAQVRGGSGEPEARLWGAVVGAGHASRCHPPNMPCQTPSSTLPLKDTVTSGGTARCTSAGQLVACNPFLYRHSPVHVGMWPCLRASPPTAAALLSPGSGLLFVYGPFAVDGAMSEGNAAFDVSLRAKDPAWGLRDTRDVAAWAEAQGLALVATHAMPANNLTLVFRRK